MLDFVEKITLHAYKVTPEDVDALRGHGFTDEEIVDIVLAAAARSFMSKTLDALGARADADYVGDPELEPLAAFGQ